MNSIVVSPLLDWPFIWTLSAIGAVMCGLGLWWQQKGTLLRTAAFALGILALLNPSTQSVVGDPLDEVVWVISDQSTSQTLEDRDDQERAVRSEVLERITQLGMVPKVATIVDDPEGRGSLIGPALRDLAETTLTRQLAGVLVLTDGQIHDATSVRVPDVPVHVLITGERDAWDSRLRVLNAPAFGVLGEPVPVRIRVEDNGMAPRRERATVLAELNGEQVAQFSVEIGQEIELSLELPHGGQNLFSLTVVPDPSEVTDQNNTAVLSINGIRDRLRVLLVSGEPHAGTRTWRNLLKSDSSVDLVHFTILRPPEKQDNTPVSEMSLIAFPTRELFLEKIDDFDLIIFDRYKRRGILPSAYLENIARYVQDGGAVLVAAGPDYASANSIYRSPLQSVLPGQPSARVLSQEFTPALSDLGGRHPVTQGLEGAREWGPWFRQVEIEDPEGHVLMTGVEDAPLLVVSRVEQGRVALLASDHAWLWHRQVQGGGPQQELLRRLAHWLMQEPELEEETLRAVQTQGGMTVTRRTLNDAVDRVSVISPSGGETNLSMSMQGEGLWSVNIETEEQGVFQLRQGDLETVVALGPPMPKEFETPLATDANLGALATSTTWVEENLPQIRSVSENRRQKAGRGWIGLTPRSAVSVTGVSIQPVVPTWILLSAAALLALFGWIVASGRIRHKYGTRF